MKRFTIRCGVVAASLLIAAAPTAPASATSSTLTKWQFAPDFRAHPDHNSFSSYRGGPAAWSLRASQSLAHDGNYPLLTAFSTKFGSAGIEAWHGNTSSCVKLPAIGVNTVNKSLPLCAGHVPGKAAFVRPDATHMPIVAWTSPFDGTVTISHDAIADVDGTCGDGITYYVEKDARRLSLTRLANNDAMTLPQMTVHIRKGHSLYFIVDDGLNGNFGCDTTQLQITIDRV